MDVNLLSFLFCFPFKKELMNESCLCLDTFLESQYFVTRVKLENTITSTTGKSFSEALILASINPQYDKRLFIEL